MATVNLGNIKLNWKGAYNSSHAYIVDDVVSYNGSSYVCILASTGNLPTVTTYWNQMSAAGTDGTDVGTIITTQGDILYRDASGLARLAAGTSGQVLQTGGTGANPSWGTVSSDYVHISTTTLSSAAGAISMQGIFTSDYKNYRVIARASSDTSGRQMQWHVMTGTNTVDTGNRYWFGGFQFYGQSGTTGGGHYGTAAYDSVRPHENMSTSTSNPVHWDINFYDPLNTSYKTHFTSLYAGYDNSYLRSIYSNGFHDNTVAVTGIYFSPSGSGNFNSGATVDVYGLKV